MSLAAILINSAGELWNLTFFENLKTSEIVLGIMQVRVYPGAKFLRCINFQIEISLFMAMKQNTLLLEFDPWKSY